MKKIVALLPMKAHSARVSGKNFRVLVNKPLYRWVLESLIAVDEIEHIIINTDARDILEEDGLNDGFGSGRVLIRDRRPDICGDLVSMNDIIEDDLTAVNAQTYIMTHTTNPFLSSSTIRAALLAYKEAVDNGEADSLFSVNKIQTRFYRADGSAVNHDPDALLRTQDLEPWFEENSNLYIFSKTSFARTNARIGVRPLMFETPMIESIDIDTPEQWDIAEAVGAYRTNGW
jgi:CMP-N-acetylneuraminic acid synthetase